MLVTFFRKQWVKLDLELAVKALDQKKDDINVATQLALQRNAETMALIAQQGAQPKAQGAAQQNTGRRGSCSAYPLYFYMSVLGRQVTQESLSRCIVFSLLGGR